MPNYLFTGFIISALPLIVSLRASCLTFLNLSLLICKIILATSKVLMKVKLHNACKTIQSWDIL